jgi:hypothetical protein
VPPQPTTTTTTPTTTTQPPPQYPVLLSGRVLDANGQPAVGSVAAFSDLNGAGATQNQDLLGSTNADASGNFVLTADPASPEMQRATTDAATYNGGWMNIDVYVESGNTLVYTGIARLLAGGQFLSNSPGAPGDDGMRRTFLMKKGTPGFRAIPPQRGRRLQQLAFCLPQTTVLSTANANAIVGNMHTANNMTGWFRYGRKADTDFGVGVSADGLNWSASGSAHVSNSVSAAVTWNATSEYGYRLLSNFTFQKTKTVCVGIPGLPPEYKIKVKSWNGGATLGQNVHNLDHQCRTKYPANVVSFAPGTKFDRSANSAVNYKAGVTIFGISLSAKSGYSTDVAAHWDFHARNVLCGTTGPPTVALTVLAG